MNRLRTFTMATLVALAFTACDEAEVVTPPPPPPTPVGTIGGLVLIEGTGATGVTVTLSSGATQATGAGGVFAFTGVEAGSYSVSISGFADDVTFTNTTQLAAINSDGQVVNLNFNGSYIRTSSIVGSVVVENRAGKHTMGMGMDLLGGLEGVTVRLGGDHAMGETDKTSSSGGFSFTGLRAGSYTVTLTGLPGNVRFESNEMSVDVGVGAVAEAHFADGTEYYEEGTLRGRLYLDGNGNDVYELNVDGVLEVDSVVITLEGGTVGMNVTTMTDSTGSFEFKYLEEGSYRVWIDAKDEALKGQNVSLRGTGRSETLEVKANSMVSAHFGFDVDKFMAKVPVVYGNDGSGNTKNPADSVRVTLYSQPKRTSADSIGTALSDSKGIATIEVNRSILKDLPAKSIVFAQVFDPDPDTGENNSVDVVDDEVVTFTLDKGQFSTLADEDHNLLWREIKLTANYVDQDGKPVRKEITDVPEAGNALVTFTADFAYRAKSSDKWGDVVSAVSDGDDQTGVRINDKNSDHDGAWQVAITINQVGSDDQADYGQYGLVDVTSALDTLIFKEEGPNGLPLTADSTRLDVDRVKATADDSATIKYNGSDFTATTGTTTHPIISAKVDGSSNEVHLGDFVVSYPHADVTFTTYRERNDVSGYQDAKADKKNPDAAEATPSTGVDGSSNVGYTLRFVGDDANGDKYGLIACTFLENTNKVNCPTAPANADSWTIIASRGTTGEGDSAVPVTVEDANIRFMPLPYPGAMVQTDADSAATATATAPATDMAYAFDVGTALEALVGAKVPGVLGWKYQNQILNFTVVNEKGVVASAAPPEDDTDATGVADLTVTAMLSESALGYNAERDTLHTVKNTTADGLAAFTDLLEGSYTVTVVKHNVETPRTMRAVLYDSKGKRSGTADLAGYASERQVVYDASRSGTEDTSPRFQEVEYRGSISGYVFNASNDNATVDDYEALAGYVVMARKMKPNTSGRTCTVPDPDKRTAEKVDSIFTDEKGMYTFNLWEGCYDIMTGTTYTAQPAARKGFTVSEHVYVDETNPQNNRDSLTYAATEAFKPAFNDGNGDTDFEVIYASGSVRVAIRNLVTTPAVNTDTAVANMNVYLFKCKLGATVNKLAETVGGSPTVSAGDCGSANRTAVKDGLKTTAANGTATWTNLPEGWYMVSPQSPTTDGEEYNVSGARQDGTDSEDTIKPVQVFQPDEKQFTEYIRINVPRSN